MATEPTSPKTGIILKGAVIAIGTLLVVHGALVAYFDHYAQAEELRKFGNIAPEALMSLRADEKERLHSGPVPIDRAMQQLATRGRTASPEITPNAAAPKDLAPMQGWTKLPTEVPSPMAAPPSSASPSASPLDAGPATAPSESSAAPKPKPERSRPDRGATPSKPVPKNP
jgi:hypothetical protein